LKKTIIMNMNEYIRYISYKYHPGIEDFIINSFIEMITHSRTYSISSDELLLWNILDSTQDIVTLFIAINLIENKDYNTCKFTYCQDNTIVIKYHLTFIGFKKCMMYSDSKYKNYFIEIEYYAIQYFINNIKKDNKILDFRHIKKRSIITKLFIFIQLVFYNHIERRLINAINKIF